MYLLMVSKDTWKMEKWRPVAVFSDEGHAIGHGYRFKIEHGPSAGYRVTELPLDPDYNEWHEKEDEE